ncbi:MAG: exonuclease SbcCD subunit D [Clostridiales bacterium]|nr:exonuclease SbcCD subunit D [Clostridiales bacterium]
MRILHTADWHLGKNLEGYSRLQEQEMFLDDFVKIVKENNIDLVIIAGDVYDSFNPPAKAEKLFYDTLKKISEGGKRLSLVIAGNHDSPERLVAAGPLAMEHGIIMIGTPKTIIPTGNYGKHKVIDSGEGYIEIEINNEKSVILTIPYPSEKRLNEVLYGEMDDEEEKLKSYGERINELFDSLKDKYREDTINLVVSHLYTMGSEEAGSERSIQLGGSYIVPASCFPREAQYVALGHIHKPMIVPKSNKKVRYSGSPLQYSKKEANTQKGCILLDIKANKEVYFENINFKTYKPIDIWKCNSIEDAIEMCKKNKDRDSYVYLEIKTDRYIREDEIKEMKSNKKDILEINPKITGIYENNNSEEILDKPFKEIFQEFYMKERGVEPEKEVVDILMSILSKEEDNNETN